MGSAQSSPSAVNNVASPDKGKGRTGEEDHLDPEGPASLNETGKHILVVGPTGSGKTAFIKLATDMDIEPGHTTDTDTNDIRSYTTSIDGQPFTFIDTPGFSELDNDNHITVIKICHWLCDNIFAYEKDIHGILCLQDIGVPKTTLAMKCTAEFLQASIGGNDARNIAFVTTKWDALNPSKLSQFEVRHEGWGRTALWRQVINSGAILFRHYGISNTTDDNEDDVQRAQQSKQDLLSRFVASHSVGLQLREQFEGRCDRGSTAKWLVNAMPSLDRFSRQEASSRENLTQGDLCQTQNSEGYFTPTNIAAAVGAGVAGVVAYHYRDDIKRAANAAGREVRKAHTRMERKTGMDWNFWPTIQPDGKIGIGGSGRMR